MSVPDCLKTVARAVHPPCAKCPYRLGLVCFVTDPCPACSKDGYRMYDILVQAQRNFPKVGGLEICRERADDEKIIGADNCE